MHVDGEKREQKKKKRKLSLDCRCQKGCQQHSPLTVLL